MPHVPTTRARAFAPLAATLFGVACAVVTLVLDLQHPDVLPSFIPSTDMRNMHVDFDTFWHSAVALHQGGDIYATPAKLKNLNPPLLTVLLAPFGLLDALTAYRIWVVLTLLMVVGALAFVARELRVPAPATVLVLLAVLASSPVQGTLVLGQIYPLLLVFLAAGWLAERRDREVLGAVLYGVAVALKPSLAPILLLPLVTRRWSALRAGIGSAVVASLVGVAICGPSSGPGWLRMALAEPVPDTVDNASLPGLAVRFGLPPTVGLVAGVAVLLATFGWLERRRDRLQPAGTAVWAVLAAGLLLSPIAWHNYLMLLWPGVLLLLARGRGPTVTALLAVAVIPVSWNAPGAPGVLVGHSLYFLVLVAYWLVLLRAAERRTGPGPVSGAIQSTPAGGSCSTADAGRPCQVRSSASTPP